MKSKLLFQLILHDLNDSISLDMYAAVIVHDMKYGEEASPGSKSKEKYP